MDENTEETETQPPIHRQYNAKLKKEAYFADLEEWRNQAAQSQNVMVSFYAILASYSQMWQMQLTSFSNAETAVRDTEDHQEQVPVVQSFTFSRFRVLDEGQQQEVIERIGGYEYIVAPFWKRAVAESIDVLIEFILKLLMFAVASYLNLDVGLDFKKILFSKTIANEDLIANFFDLSIDFVTLSSDLVTMELLTKLLVCCYEACWTVWHNGATPGKSVMKLRIHYVEAVMPLEAPAVPQFIFQLQREPMRALLFPVKTPSWLRAFLRALAKNLVMTLLFPLCVVMIFFINNRTAYDIVTKTIVVETNSSAIYRPPQQPHPQIP